MVGCGVRVSGKSHCKAHVTNVPRSSQRIRHHLPRREEIRSKRNKKEEVLHQVYKTISKYRNQVIFSWLKFYGTENNVYGSVYPGTHTGHKSVFSTSPCLQSTPVVPIYTPTAISAIILKKICLPSIPIVGQAGFLLILKFSSCKTSV